MKILVFYLSILIIPVLSLAQTENNRIQQAINRVASDEDLKSAAISFSAYDLDGDTVLAEYNAYMTLPSASTAKLFSTATAIEILGPNFKPKTEIYLNGVIVEGILQGDVVIRALGDASLGSSYLFQAEEKDLFLEEWSSAIYSKGVRAIEGRVIVDGSAFGYQGAPDGWNWSDLGNYYGAGPSAAAVNDNMVRLHFSTSNQLNGPTFLDSLTPPIPGFELDNQVTTYNSNSDNAYIYGAPYSNERFAIGNLPRNRSNFQVRASIPDPEILLAYMVQEELKKQGIESKLPAIGYRTLRKELTEKPSYADFTLVHTHIGKPVLDVAYWTNLRSVNFFAEQLLSLTAYQKTGNGTTSNSAKYAANYWNSKLGTKLFLRDGSGLSRSNGFSANDFILLLKYMNTSKYAKEYKETLPVAGESGTLRSVCRGQAGQGRVFAKSGTMNKIKSYAGYITSKSGKNIAFSITINNYELTNAQLMKKIEYIFNEMANF